MISYLRSKLEAEKTFHKLQIGRYLHQRNFTNSSGNEMESLRREKSKIKNLAGNIQPFTLKRAYVGTYIYP